MILYLTSKKSTTYNAKLNNAFTSLLQENNPNFIRSFLIPKMIKTKTLISFVVVSFLAIFLLGRAVYADTAKIIFMPWKLFAWNRAVEKYQTQINPYVLKGKDTLRVTYNLRGNCIMGGDASAIVFDQPAGAWHFVSLANYGKNCFIGDQTVEIPLSDFKGLDTNQAVSVFHVRFWLNKLFTIDIKNVEAFTKNATPPSSTPTPTKSPTPTPTTKPTTTPAPSTTPKPTVTVTPTQAVTPTPTVPVSAKSWDIESVSSMKETKDKICGQDDPAFIQSWVNKAAELGVNYVAVETPYDNPACGNSLTYTKAWIDAIRAKGLKVWHRHMPMAFEGIYDQTKKNNVDYMAIVESYIKNNPGLFKEGDIFTPIPEPQNGGINGITYCAQSVCQFSSKEQFNQWLRDAMTRSNNAFSAIGLAGKIKVGYFGFDGFVAWGSNNPDWHGILEDSTVAQMGNITIDHYPELIGQTMKQGLDELQARYPNVPIVIGEWGSAGNTDPQQQVLDSMGAAKRLGVIGFNYWHLGMGGNEALINSDFTNKSQFDEVQSFFQGLR